MAREGFTLLEMLLSFAIWSMLIVVVGHQVFGGGTSFPLIFWTERIGDVAREAQARAMSGDGDDVYGLHVDETNDELTLFKGSSWGARDLTWSGTLLELPDSISLSSSVGDGGDIVFSEVTGATSTSADLTLTNSRGVTRQVDIGEYGTIDIQATIAD